MITAIINMLTIVDDFFIRALIGGLGICLITGPLGCLLLWRRLSFFGDALAHTALLGVALGVILHIDVHVSVIVICLISAFILAFTHTQQIIPSDAWLGITSYGALALGMTAISYTPHLRFDPASYLFGDILAITATDLIWIYGCCAITWSLISFQWRQLVLLCIDEELAQTVGVSAFALKSLFMVILALAVAVALKTVGALLVPALLILPAASARCLAKTPKKMVLLTTFLSMVATLLGLEGSLVSNTPSGPAIIVAGVGLFIAILIYHWLKQQVSNRWGKEIGGSDGT